MSLKNRQRGRRLKPPEINPRASSGANPPIPKKIPEENRPKGGFFWRWREAARRFLGNVEPEAGPGGPASSVEAEIGGAAEASADTQASGGAVELSEAGTRLAVRSEPARLGGGLARAGGGLIGKTALAALAVAVLGLLASGRWRPDFIVQALRLGPIGPVPPIPSEAPSSLPYASSGLSKIEGANSPRGQTMPTSGLAARQSSGAGSDAETALRLSPTLSLEGGGKGGGGVLLKAGISSSPIVGGDAGGRALSSPPGGFFAPNAAPTNALQGFVSGDVNPGRHGDPALAQAAAPGRLDAFQMGGLVNGRSEALGQLRSASSLNASMQRAGENETAAVEGQAQFDNPAQAAGVAGEGFAATGGGDGPGAGSVVNGPQGAPAVSPGAASVSGGGMSRNGPGSGGGLAACSDSNLSQCKEPLPSSSNPLPGSPWQPLLDKAILVVGIGEGLLIAASVLALAGEMLGPYGWPLLMAAYVLATGAAALGAWAIALGIQAHGMGALPERAWIDGALGGMLIAGAGGVFLGGPGAVAGLILGAVGLVGTIVTSLLGKF